MMNWIAKFKTRHTNSPYQNWRKKEINQTLWFALVLACLYFFEELMLKETVANLKQEFPHLVSFFYCVFVFYRFRLAHFVSGLRQWLELPRSQSAFLVFVFHLKANRL